MWFGNFLPAFERPCDLAMNRFLDFRLRGNDEVVTRRMKNPCHLQ